MFLLEGKNKAVTFRNLLIFLTIVLTILTVLSYFLPYIAIFSNLIFFLINIFVLIVLVYVVKKSSKYGKRAFRGWILITLSLFVTILGNIIWVILPVSFNQLSSPSIADIFYLAYYPLFIAGILYLPVTQVHEIKKYQILIDTGIIIVSAAMGLWVVLITHIIELNLENTISMTISLSYLLLDIFLLFTLFYLLFNWFGKVKKAPLFILTMSAAILIITSLIFIHQSLYGSYISGGILDAGWLISYILTALAGISYINNEKIKFFSSFSYKLPFKANLSSYLPLLWLFLIYMLLFWIYTHPEHSNLNLLIFGAVIITMMFSRQILALEDSNRTRKQLQFNQDILEKRERHLSLITDNMIDLITRIDANGVYQYVSPSAQKVIEYDPEYLLGKNVLDFVHPDDLEQFKSALLKSVRNRYLNETEFRYKKSSGDYIWLETVGTPLFDHKNNLIGFIRSSRNIDDRKHAEKQIKASLEEKEVLLKEIHHRVKNNMQIISSLLSLQSHYIEDKKSLAILKESQNRVRSMAMIHENLYRSENLAKINLAEYIYKLVYGLFISYGVSNGMIKTQMDLNDVLLDIDTAIPCGLILNELITNSIKHGFPETEYNESISDPPIYHEEKRNIFIKLSDDENITKMVVADNGIGFPEDLDFKNTGSLGLQLVNSLVAQLNGVIELERDNGTKFTVRFKKNNIKN